MRTAIENNRAVRFLISVLMITLIVSMTPLIDTGEAHAAEATTITADMVEWEPNDDGENTCTIIGYKESFPGGSVNIPSNLQVGNTSYRITRIGSSAFWYCSSLTSVTIPDSVTSIGRTAFYNCSSLISITIPDSVTSIGSSAFNECSSLTSITIPDSVTSIGDYAFSLCRSLTSITISDSVTSIGSFAFSFCSSLTSITIPDSVTSIGDCAFWSCRSLTSVTIPDSVTSIGNNAFSACSSLTSITIPDSVTSIGSSAFGICSKLENVVMSKNITTIDETAFNNCTKLYLVVITPARETVAIGKTQQLQAYYWPTTGLSSDKSYPVFSSGNIVVASVDSESGAVTAKKAGYSTITAVVKWNPSSGSVIERSATSTVTVPQNVSVRYNANGGEGAPAAQTKQYGEPLTLSSETPTREGYIFRGWSSVKDGSVEYSPGDQYTEEEHITLYAVWENDLNHDHEYDAGVVTLEPTCTEDGEKVFTCQICGYERHDRIDALGHD